MKNTTSQLGTSGRQRRSIANKSVPVGLPSLTSLAVGNLSIEIGPRVLDSLGGGDAFSDDLLNLVRLLDALNYYTRKADDLLGEIKTLVQLRTRIAASENSTETSEGVLWKELRGAAFGRARRGIEARAKRILDRSEALRVGAESIVRCVMEVQNNLAAVLSADPTPEKALHAATVRAVLATIALAVVGARLALDPFGELATKGSRADQQRKDAASKRWESQAAMRAQRNPLWVSWDHILREKHPKWSQRKRCEKIAKSSSALGYPHSSVPNVRAFFLKRNAG